MRVPHVILLPCRTHAERETEGRCEGCLLPFCHDCLVGIAGRRLCAGCKVLALREIRRRSGHPARDADEALVFSLMGTVPFLSPILAPVAIWKGVAVVATRWRDPSLPGRGKGLAAIGVSVVVLCLWFLGVAWLLRR